MSEGPRPHLVGVLGGERLAGEGAVPVVAQQVVLQHEAGAPHHRPHLLEEHAQDGGDRLGYFVVLQPV